MTKILSPDLQNIQKCANLLRQDRLVAFGTETVYGLGANATSPLAIDKIYKVKGRPKHNPLICHVSSLEDAQKLIIFNDLALSIARQFWPGPLTLILPRRDSCLVCAEATNNLPHIAVRVPSLKRVRALIKAAQIPIVAPSANPSGKISPTRAQDVYRDFNTKIAAILDTGPCTVGLESTVLDLSQVSHPILRRPGGITYQALQSLSPYPIMTNSQQTRTNRTSPGLSPSHYAPHLPVRLNAHKVHQDEALLAFGKSNLRAKLMFNLSEDSDLTQAAANLYHALHFLDREGVKGGFKGIAVQPIPQHGLGDALCDRLTRAAAPRKPSQATPRKMQ